VFINSFNDTVDYNNVSGTIHILCINFYFRRQ